jgi:hypothetical protein
VGDCGGTCPILTVAGLKFEPAKRGRNFMEHFLFCTVSGLNLP